MALRFLRIPQVGARIPAVVLCDTAVRALHGGNVIIGLLQEDLWAPRRRSHDRDDLPAVLVLTLPAFVADSGRHTVRGDGPLKLSPMKV